MHIELTGFAYLDDASLGKLRLGDVTLYTIERPWLDNLAMKSCIPEGAYPLEWDTTGRIKDVPRLRETEPRTQINIHAANYAHELHGCIAPGLSYDLKPVMVQHSRAAMKYLLDFMRVDELNTNDGDALGYELVINSAHAW